MPDVKRVAVKNARDQDAGIGTLDFEGISDFGLWTLDFGRDFGLWVGFRTLDFGL